MIAVSAPLAAALPTMDHPVVADLYTLTLAGGTAYYWTSAPISITYGGHTYVSGGSSGAPIVKRGTIRLTSTLEVDTLDVTLECGEGALLGSTPLVQAAVSKALDGATFRVDYAFLLASGAWDVVPARFVGNVAEVNPGSTEVALTVKSDLEDLAKPLPRRTYQVQCGHSLFDSNCGLSASTYAVALTALSGATTTLVTATGTNASGWFDGGYVTWAAGERATVLTQTLSAGVLTFTLAAPLSFVPGVGASFSAHPGCDKTKATCLSKFGNPTRFGGFPFIPRKTQSATGWHSPGPHPNPKKPPVHDP